ILGDPKSRGDSGQAIGIRHRKALGIFEQNGEGHTVVSGELRRLFLVVLRNADDRDLFAAVALVNAFEIGKLVLAYGARNLKKNGQYGASPERVLEGKSRTVQGWQVQRRGDGSRGQG